MTSFIYLVAERLAGQAEMQRFAHPIHVGIVSAADLTDAYDLVLGELRPIFADAPQPLEVRFQEMQPRLHGIWLHHSPVDFDITFTDRD